MTNGVILMAYGAPRTPEEIEAYYTDIRRGRPPTPEQLADLSQQQAPGQAQVLPGNGGGPPDAQTQAS